MNFTRTFHEADQTNVSRMWELNQQRSYHLKNLQMINRDKELVRLKSEKDHLKRSKQLGEYRKIKNSSFDRRNKSFQDRINYENSLLLKKIADVSQEGPGMGPGQRAESTRACPGRKRSNPFQNKQDQEVYQTNLKMATKLIGVKSQLNSRMNLKEHEKMMEQYSEMIKKKSPKKKAYMKSLLKKQQCPLLPEIHNPNY